MAFPNFSVSTNATNNIRAKSLVTFTQLFNLWNLQSISLLKIDAKHPKSMSYFIFPSIFINFLDEPNRKYKKSHRFRMVLGLSGLSNLNLVQISYVHEFSRWTSTWKLREIDGTYPPFHTFSNLGLVIQPLRNWTQGLFHLGHFLHDFHHLLMGNEEIEICKKNSRKIWCFSGVDMVVPKKMMCCFFFSFENAGAFF